MKNFIIKYLMFVVPILALLLVLERLNQQFDKSSVFYKKKYIIDNKSNIEGIVFGPSYTWRGIYPKYLNHKVASLALADSSPNVDHLLYEYSKTITKPKFIIFDLSLGYLRKYNSVDWMKSHKLPYYFSTIRGNELKDLFITEYPLKSNASRLLGKINKYDKWGFNYKIPESRDFFAQLNFQDSLIVNHEKTKDLLTIHRELTIETDINSNIDLYKKIVHECKANEIKIIFISPPKYHIYNNNVDVDKEYLIERTTFLNEVVDNKECFFFNFEKSYEEETTLFFNINHLNTKGAKVFTQELNRVLVEEVLL